MYGAHIFRGNPCKTCESIGTNGGIPAWFALPALPWAMTVGVSHDLLYFGEFPSLAKEDFKNSNSITGQSLAGQELNICNLSEL